MDMGVMKDWMFPIEFYKIGGLFPYEKDKQGNTSIALYLIDLFDSKILIALFPQGIWWFICVLVCIGRWLNWKNLKKSFFCEFSTKLIKSRTEMDLLLSLI